MGCLVIIIIWLVVFVINKDVAGLAALFLLVGWFLGLMETND